MKIQSGSDSETNSLHKKPKRKQVSRACEFCQSRKLKCDTKLPCYNCQRNQIECVLSPRKKRQRHELQEANYSKFHLNEQDKPPKTMRENHAQERPKIAPKIVQTIPQGSPMSWLGYPSPSLVPLRFQVLSQEKNKSVFPRQFPFPP